MTEEDLIWPKNYDAILTQIVKEVEELKGQIGELWQAVNKAQDTANSADMMWRPIG